MERRIVRSDDVIWNFVDDEVVALNQETGIYYGLNRTAAALWDLTEKPKSESEIIKHFIATFDAEVEVITQDVRNLIDDLLEKQLIKTV